MAAPKRNRVRDDEVRARIQTTQLVKRLHDDGLGKIELKDGQRKSIEILLRKSLPDLSSLTLKGDEHSPLFSKVEYSIVDAGAPDTDR